MSLTGGCRCGAVRYTLALAALPLAYACHCRDCQTWSGSGFALNAMLPQDAFTIEGHPREFVIEAGESQASRHLGCPECLTRIANTNAAIHGMVVLRAGTLDRSDELSPAVHIWTSRKQPWLTLPPEAPAFAQTPTPEQFGAALASLT